MIKNIKGYLSGMNQDGAKNKENNNSYFSALDFRIVTDKGKSTGSLENERGTKIAFKVPDLAEMTLDDGTVIPAQTNLNIIGWGTIVDTIVIFTTNEHAIDNTASYGQIWKLEFNETSGEVIGLSSGELTVANHLVYNQQLNFSTYHRIGRVIGRYETDKIKRVYWTDNYNSVRSFNIADEDTLNYPLENINLQPSVTFSQPIIQTLGSGNLPTGCEIQFGYRLLDDSGIESLISPLSALYPLPNINIYSVGFSDFEGSGDTSTKTRSVTYEIKDIDTDYTVIEHIAILYTAPDVYTIYKFDEQTIPDSGVVTVTCSSLDNAIEITPLELNLLSSGFDICKDIEVKDDRLIAANIKTNILELPDYDTRAYRFNSARTCLITDSVLGNNTIDGPSKVITSGPNTGSLWTDVNAEHDAINMYNQENDSNWFTLLQYKYKSDGTTLGGEGPNISYEFVKKEIPANFQQSLTTAPSHIEVNRWSVADGDDVMTGQLHADGSTFIIENSEQFKNNSSAYNHAYFRGYARGETYRFAIVFFDKKGSTSFASWIGDIRIPDVEDGYPIGTELGGLEYLYSIGIKFNVDITSIKDKIDGYRIVRVERTTADKTKLGSGLLQLIDQQDETYETTLLHNWEGSNDGAPSPSNPFTISDDVEIYGSVETGVLHLSDKPGFHDPQFNSSSTNRITYLVSPIGQLYPVDFKPGDFIKTTGYHRATCNKYYLNGATTDPDTDKDYGFYYKTKLFIPYTSAPFAHGKELFEIGHQQLMQQGQYFPAGSAIFSGYTGEALMNASYCRNAELLVLDAKEEHPLGIGSPKLLMLLTPTPSITNNSGDPAATMVWYEGGLGVGGDYRAMNFAGTDTSGYVYFKEVLYCRYLSDQYGGNTFADRSKNQYISTNHYQIITDNSPNSFNTDVFGGDVFVNYYDDEQIERYINQDAAFGEPYKVSNVNKLSVAFCFPVESPCNTNYRVGRHWAADRGSTGGFTMGDYQSNQYIYNHVFSQQPIAEQKFFAKDFLIETNEENPFQLWASEPKINGELLDKWRVFKPANKTEVTGTYGPINRIKNYKDRLFFYQDMALGIASINERSIITDQSGQQAVLGTGGIFPDYQYLSTITGCYHQFAVVETENGLYHYDARLRKFFKTGQGVMPISDMKGMSSFFDNKITGSINKEDFTLRTIDGGPTGVHGEADYRYNRVLYTFLMPYFTDLTGIFDFVTGNIIFDNNIYYIVNSDFTFDFSIEPDITEYDVTVLTDYQPRYTISYNEVIDAFESFYSFLPGLYIQYGRRLLSVNPNDSTEAYVHNEGDFCTFYDQAPTISKLTTFLGSTDNITKIFNNIEYLSEVYDTNGVDIYTDTLTAFRVKNEYQNTGLIPFVNNTNIKRRMRTWRTAIPRNSGGKDRIRNPWVELSVEYQNAANKRLVLHELVYDYTAAPM